MNQKWNQTSRVAADQPVRTLKEDLLGRENFAKALAQTISNWREPESLVVALTGPWGSGKSSITNFILEIIQQDTSRNKIDILKFNPWHNSSQLTAGDRLLSEISVALRHNNKSEADQHIAKKWQQWTAALQLPASTLDAFSQTPAALYIGGALTLGLSPAFQSPFIEAALQALSAFAIATSLFLRLAATVTEKAAAFFSVRAAATAKTLDELKSELRILMGERDRQLLVIIDDIDRLPQPEVQSLLRAVRANADFPNLVFLLAFERDVVEKAIADQAHIDGGEYLKKIIQIPFSIPPATPTQIQNILLNSLADLTREFQTTAPFDQQRWSTLFTEGISHYFSTLRDVYRYMATLTFHLGMFRSGQTLEVNQIDLIGLETLRVFEPQIYEALPRFKNLLLEGPGYSGSSEQKKLALEELEALLSLSTRTSNHSIIKKILSAIFEPLEWLLINYGYGDGFEGAWERELRACSKKNFARYFHLSLTKGDVSQSEIEAILQAAPDHKNLVAKMHRLQESGLLISALERLDAYKEEISTQAALPFATALFDIGDKLPSASTPFSTSAEMHAARIIYWIFRRIADGNERANLLANALNATIGIQLPVYFLNLEERREGKTDHSYILTEASLSDLRSICVDKILTASKTGRLIDHPEIATIMFFWLKWTDGTAPRAWASLIASHSAGALALIRGFTRDVHSYTISDRAVKSRPQIRLEELEHFLPISSLEKIISSIDIKSLDEKNSRSVAAFLQAMMAWHTKHQNLTTPGK